MGYFTIDHCYSLKVKDGVIEKMTFSEASFGRYIMSSTIAKISEMELIEKMTLS